MADKRQCFGRQRCTRRADERPNHRYPTGGRPRYVVRIQHTPGTWLLAPIFAKPGAIVVDDPISGGIARPVSGAQTACPGSQTMLVPLATGPLSVSAEHAGVSPRPPGRRCLHALAGVRAEAD